MPILTMSGLAGRLFAPMALAYIFSILASLAVALTVTPALCAILFRDRLKPVPTEGVETGFSLSLKTKYCALLFKVERHPAAAIGAVAFVTVAGLALIPLLGRAFLPELHETHYLVHMEMAPGTSIAESARVGAIAQRALMALPFVREVGQRVGRAESDDVYGPQTSEIEVDLKEAGAPVEDVRAALDKIPGAVFSVNTFLTERIEETISGYTAPVVVHVVGNDLDLLDTKAQEIARILGGLSGAADVQVTAPPGTPEVVVRLRPRDVARWGFDPVDVLETLRVAYSGHVVGQLFEGNRVFDVAAILPPEQRSSIDTVSTLPLRSPGGQAIRLRDVADIFQSSGRSIVQHEAARRVQNITCNVEGRDVGSFVAEAKQAVAKVPLPAGAYIEFTGAAEAEAKSRHDLIIHSSIAALGVIALLFIVMRRARNVLLVALNLPFALVGGVAAAFLTAEPLSVGSMVGFVTLFGITLRNSIMLLSHYEHLVTSEGAAWSIETAVRGAAERLVPIVMTSLVTALGLLPLALGRSAPGREIEGAMAVVILGGLITSTALNLLILPTLAFRYGRFGGTVE
jgi:Cu/Ag efflux pump CusA